MFSTHNKPINRTQTRWLGSLLAIIANEFAPFIRGVRHTMNFICGIIFLMLSSTTFASECKIDETKFADQVKLVEQGYGNFIVTAPIELESKPFQTMYLVIVNKNKAPLIQGELRTTVNDNLAMAHINVTENNGLNAHITIYWEPQGGGCPIIVRKSV